MDVANPCLIWYLVKFNRVWAPFLSSKKVWLQYSQYFELLKVWINKVLHFSSADNWEHFRRADLLQEALQNMRMGNLSVGLTIWVQHQVRAGYRIFRNLKMRTQVSYRWNSIAWTPIDQSSWSLEVKTEVPFLLLYKTKQIYSLSLELPISQSSLSLEPRPRSFITHFNVFYSPSLRVGSLVSDRICKHCSLGNVEDEFHFILICPFYARIREKHIKQYYYKNPSALKLIQLLSTENVSESCTIITFNRLYDTKIARNVFSKWRLKSINMLVFYRLK